MQYSTFSKQYPSPLRSRPGVSQGLQKPLLWRTSLCVGKTILSLVISAQAASGASWSLKSQDCTESRWGSWARPWGQQLWLFLPVILADCYGCLQISLRETTPLVTAQGAPQEMPLEVREPNPGQPKFPLPSWLIHCLTWVSQLGTENTETAAFLFCIGFLSGFHPCRSFQWVISLGWFAVV